MGEPKAITYKEVDNIETWRKVCDAAGAGQVPVDVYGDASIDLSGLSEAKQARIDKIVAGGKDDEAEPKAGEEAAEEKSKKRGNQ